MSRNHKNSRNKELLIIEFCFMIKELIPSEIETLYTNEKHQILIAQLEPKAKRTTEILIHHLAQLYQNHRVKIGNSTIEIADEDVLTALKIIENLNINTLENKPVLDQKYRSNYIKIRDKFSGKLFIAKELEKELQLQKSQINDILKLLLEKKLIERYGFANKGYCYKLIEFKQTKTIEIKSKNNDIFDDFDDFNDNENIDYQYKKDNFRY